MILLVAESEEDAWVTLPAELFFVPLLLPLALVAVWIYTLVNAAKYRDEEFRAVRSSKTMWIVLLCLLAFWVAPVYYATTHRRLRRLRREHAGTASAAAP